MASRAIVVLTDDIDGGNAVETVTFGLDADSYEIDLSAKNAKGLRGALKSYVAVAHRSGGRGGRVRPTDAPVRVLTRRPYALGRRRTTSRSPPAAGISAAVLAQYAEAGN